MSKTSTISTVKFCRKCNNLLYPREDTEKKNLVYGCHNCDHQEPAESNIVYYKEIRRTGDARTPMADADPVLPRTKSVRCAKCHHGEAVFFEAATTDKDRLTLFFVCCNPKCGHRWKD